MAKTRPAQVERKRFRRDREPDDDRHAASQTDEYRQAVTDDGPFVASGHRVLMPKY